jgi:DNA-binding LacI/PurR family transcriptional regulator
MNMDARTLDARIGVASLSLGAGFPGLMYALLQKQRRPEHVFLECSVVLEKTTEHLRTRLLAMLEGDPRPSALVGLCIRPDPRTVAAYRAAGIPIVLVDEEVEGTSTVASDNLAGGLMAARHLIASGRRTLGLVAGNTHLEGGYNALQRLKGFTKGLAEAGLTLPPGRVVEVTNYSRKEGVEALEEMLKAWPNLDGVFCAAGDVCATGILSAAQQRGVKVPEQLAVVGYDDNAVAATTGLTTLLQPMEQLAQEAYRLATEETRELLVRPRRILLEPRLVVRSSTGPAVRGEAWRAPRAAAR